LTNKIFLRWSKETVTDFGEFLNKFPDYEKIKVIDEQSKTISSPSNCTFFVKPSLEQLNEIPKMSPFIIITAPGATGKSALSNFLCNEKKCFYWNLANAKIGDNYFIGTISKTFGAENLGYILNKIKNAEIGFVIDAFDEAEISCGWDRIQNFTKEIYEYVKDADKIVITLVARFETAEYLNLILNDMLQYECFYYGINFFNKDSSKIFLLDYLKNILHVSFDHKAKILEIFELLTKIIEENLPSTDIVKYPFYGYAPVIQAIATLIKDSSNLQELENHYKTNKNNNEIIEDIIKRILDREQEKFVTAFINQFDNKNILGNIKLFSPDEQLYYILCYMSKAKIIIDENVLDSGLKGDVIEKYKDSIASFIPQHPFIVNNDSFASPVFMDYTNACLLAKGKYKEISIKSILRDYASITSLFLNFYLSAREPKNIDSNHIGIMHESILAGKNNNNENIAAIYLDETSKTIFNYSSEDEKKIEVNMNGPLYFPYRLRNIVINIKTDVELGAGNDFSINNSEVVLSGNGKIVMKTNSVEIICEDIDKPISLFSDKETIYERNIKIKKIGNGELVVSWPNGKIYPWAQYFQEKFFLDQKNANNALLSLRRILKYFRKDKKDAMARYVDFIHHVAINNNQFNNDMLKYLLDTKVLWKDGALYKMASKEAEKKGVNFTALRNLELNDKLRTYLENFVNNKQV
jgi:hypothetical protein